MAIWSGFKICVQKSLTVYALLKQYMRKYDTCLQWQKVLQLYTRANMADSGSGTNVVGVELTAKDIPGADLAEPFEWYHADTKAEMVAVMLWN